MFIERNHYMEKIVPFIDKPVIKVLTGMRRVGKSTIVKMLIDRLMQKGVAQKNIVYINKELLDWNFITDSESLHAYVTDYFKNNAAKKKYIFIDEVQEIQGWEKAVNSFLAGGVGDICITGSNARLLSSDLATYLAGRYVEFPIYPLTFKEFLRFQKTPLDTVQDNFKLFIRYGGLPGLHAFELQDELIFKYLQGIYNTLILKDVVYKNRIQDPAQLDKITRFIFDNCGNITSAKRISDVFRNQNIPMSVDTVIAYLSYMEAAFLISKVSRYDLKGLKQLEFLEKFYAGDIGLRHGLIGYRDGDISGLLENVVYLELRTRGYTVHVGKIDDLEIDFIAERRGERLYIQLAYLLPDARTIDREFAPLERIQDNYPKFILTLDEFQNIERNSMYTTYLLDFLLEKP